MPAPGPEPTADLLAASNRGDGAQFVLRITAGEQTAILKSYGRKRGAIKTWLRQLGYRLHLGKSSVHPLDRFRTERDQLMHWREHGFDVPRLLEEGDAGATYLLMEDCPGPTLKEYLGSGQTDPEQRRRCIRQLAEAVGKRHQRALERDDLRLIHTHPSSQHVIVCGDRLVFFDLEFSHRPGRPVKVMVSQELFHLLNSVARAAPTQAADLLTEFAGAYPSVELFRQLRQAWNQVHYRPPKRHRKQQAGNRHDMPRTLEILDQWLTSTSQEPPERSPTVGNAAL